jgi:hypothetical protein
VHELVTLAGRPGHQALPAQLGDLSRIVHQAKAADDRDRPRVAVVIEPVGLKRDHGLVNGGGKRTGRPDGGEDVAAFEGEAHGLDRGQRVSRVHDPAQQRRGQQAQTLGHRKRARKGSGVHASVLV